MASGTLGKASPAANTTTTLYIVPDGMIATLNVSFCNRGAGAAKVYLAITETAEPTDSDYLEYSVHIPSCGVLERTGIVVSGNERVVVRTDSSAVSVRAYGFEE